MHVPIKRGSLIRKQNHLYFVEDLHERHSGKQKPVVHVHLRDLKDGRHVDRTLDELLPIEPVEHTYRMVQYSYSRPGTFIFLDGDTFEEHELNESQLGGIAPFLREGQELRAMFVDGALAVLDIPHSVALHVASTAAPEHAVGAGGSVLKEATLENGLTVRVPLFIKTGDLIRINVHDRTYAGKEKES